MNKELDEVLLETAARTLEQVAFLFSMPAEEADGAPPPLRATASVVFAGPVSGVFSVSVSEGVLPVLATNMLGLDDGEDPSPAQQGDALKELANILCGNLLPKVVDPDSVFVLQAPTLVPQGAAEAGPAGLRPAATARLALDEGAVELRLFTDTG